MIIRPVIDDDIQAIAKIYTDNWKTTYQNILPDSFLKSMTYEHSKEKWSSYIHTDKQGAFVALDENDMIIGFSAYKPYSDLKKCLLLDSLHIIQSIQGSGIGKKLIFTIGKYAYNNEYEKMYICIVKGNDRAEGIYAHLGAKHYKDFIDDFEGTPSNSSVLLWDDLNMFISK
ncbi:GNAT family N-acetyltransferase [Clostridium sp. P21]|uniref:GNAT family N-acetyltransferase n=1 Tax=Clostridium muellerianum TaxID=2716538 RepID=A0A7Y0EIW7_9CLOT|nr:GNAT family N-acetyltransferase [Clostridium muellerianum]NMM64221.1 GNAT family N-acetyltransferase [Clostridium muellerianum]